jgi:hypothetical protein
MNKPVTGIRKIFIMGSGGHMKIKNNTVFLVVIWLLCLSPIIQSAGPGTITYQGNIATQSGDPPGAGIYDMRFSLWGAVTDGNMHWQETREGANGVDVSEGVFGVNLGSITPFPDNLFAAQPNLWLEVEADLNGDGFTADEIYSPRVQFTATPYAFHSSNADKVDGMDASAFIKGSASAYVVAETTDNAVTNGANLIAAYAAAAALTPHGQALGPDNRAVVLVPPGKYDLGTGQLEMATEFVDFVGLSTARENQHIYGTSNGFGTGVLRQTANDVKIENLFVELMPTGFGTNYDAQDPAAYFPTTALGSAVVRNCIFKGDDSSGWSMRLAIEYAGHYEDCTAGDYSFGHFGTASGTFKNCTGSDDSFGYKGTASGTFNNCTGGNFSFGYGSDATGGKFYFCSGGSNSFTTTGSPTVIHCIQDGVAYP